MAIKAPKGGVTIGGVKYKGGQFLPQGVKLPSGGGVQVEGLKELIISLSKMPEELDRIGKQYLRDWSIYGVKQVQLHTLNAGAADTNELIQGIHYSINQTTNGLESTIAPSSKADKYATYVEHGTKPHTPPVKALQGWADRHGIPVWAVIRKIQREGTEPRYMWRDGFADLDDRVNSELDDIANAIARKL